MELVKIKAGSKILPLEDPFRISFWGHSTATDQDIFKNFGGYVGNELPQGVEWSKFVSFKSTIWQTMAMHHACKLSTFLERISAPDQNIITKFSGYVNNGLSKCVEWSKYENPIWRTSAMYHTYNILAVNFNDVN